MEESSPLKPLTALCIVKEPSKCPPNFTCITKTDRGEDADLWKDGWFGSKITRYLCYSTDPQLSFNSFIVDIQFTDSHDIRSDYNLETATKDSKEPVLKNNLKLMYRTLPLAQTNQAIVDVSVFNKDSILPKFWSNCRTISNFKIGYRSCSKVEISKSQGGEQVASGTENNGSFKMGHMVATVSMAQSLKHNRPTAMSRADGQQRSARRDQGSSLQRQPTRITRNLNPLEQLQYSVHKSVSTGPTNNNNGQTYNYVDQISVKSIDMVDFSVEKKALDELLRHS